jgi:phage terminase large subunit-like protein
MVGNVELFTDSGGSVRADKAKSKGKIDGVAALINAIFVWMAMEKEEQQEVKIEFW